MASKPELIILIPILFIIGGGAAIPVGDNIPELYDEYYSDVFSMDIPRLDMTTTELPTMVIMELPEIRVDSLKKDFVNDPVVSSISSGVQTSLQEKGDGFPATAEDFPLLTSARTTDQAVLDALSDLLFLAKLLESNIQYMGLRTQQDPMWPFSLASKMGSTSSELTTQQQGQEFQQDLQQVVSGIVIMKMMEEKVTFINKYVQDYLSATPSEVSIPTLLGGSDGAQVVKGLFALKYLEGFLHAANMMMEEAISDDDSGIQTDGGTASAAASGGVIPYLPPSLTDDEDDIEAGIGAFLILGFTAIGFFFVLFMIVYLAWKVVQKCYEARSVVLDGKKKSKYEQI